MCNLYIIYMYIKYIDFFMIIVNYIIYSYNLYYII